MPGSFELANALPPTAKSYSFDAVIEPHDDITAEAAERHELTLRQPPFGPCVGRFGRRFVPRHSADGARFADELPRGGSPFVDFVLIFRTAAARRAVALGLRIGDTMHHDPRRQARRRTGDVARKRLRSGSALRNANRDIVFAALPRGEDIGSIRASDRLAVHAPTELRTVEVLQQRGQIHRTTGKRVTVGGALEIRRRAERYGIRHRFDHFDLQFAGRGPVDVRGVDGNGIRSERLFAERIAPFGAHDLAVAHPFDRKLLQIVVFEGRGNRIIGIRHDLEPLLRYGDRDDGRRPFQHLDLQLFLGLAGLGLHAQHRIIFADFVPRRRIDDLPAYDLIVERPRNDRVVRMLHRRSDRQFTADFHRIDARVAIQRYHGRLRPVVHDYVVFVAGRRQQQRRKENETYFFHSEEN